MTLDEQKEVTAKAICFYVADLLEKNQIKMAESAKVLSFLISRAEGAQDAEDLKEVETEFREEYSILPPFTIGLSF